MAARGYGPKGVKISKVTEATLLPLLRDLLENEPFRIATAAAARRMQAEDRIPALIDFIEQPS